MRSLGLRRGWWTRRCIDLLIWPADLLTVIDSYRSVFGRFPRLIRPRTYTELIQRHKLLVRKRRYTTYADKLAVRDFIADRIGPEVLNPVLWQGTTLRTCDPAMLPERFVIKTNHACHTNLIVTDASRFDWDVACAQVERWLQWDYSRQWGEWEYRWIRPRVFIESFLADAEGRVPVDYKFFCAWGKVQVIEVDMDRFGTHTRLMLDRDFQPYDFAWRVPRYQGPVTKPAAFEQMLEMAECVAEGEPLLRVDFYDLPQPLFSEITLHPTAGLGKFDPPEWDRRMGEWFRGRKRR